MSITDPKEIGRGMWVAIRLAAAKGKRELVLGLIELYQESFPCLNSFKNQINRSQSLLGYMSDKTQ